MSQQLTQGIIQAFGGLDNVEKIWYCATRVRMTAKNSKKVKFSDLKALPSVDEVVLSENEYQLVFASSLVQSVYNDLVATGKLSQKAEGKKYDIKKQLLGFAVGDFGKATFDFLLQTYLMLFLTTVAQMPLAAVGVLLTANKIIGGILDVVMGSILDRTLTKWGRSRPWMAMSIIVMASGAIMLFNTTAFSGSTQIIYAYISYIVYSAGFSMYNVSEQAIQAALTDVPEERTMLASARGISTQMAQLVFANIVVVLLATFGNGNTQAVAYSRTILIVAGLGDLAILVGVLLMKEVFLAPVSEKERKGNALKDIINIIKNKYAFIGICYAFANMLLTMAFNSNIAFFYTFVKNNTTLLALSISIISIASFAMNFILPLLNKKMLGSDLGRLGAIIGVVGLLIVAFFNQFDVVIYIGFILFAVGNTAAGTMFQSLVPEVFDNLEYETGQPVAGTSAGIFSLGANLGVALSGLISTTILSIGGFDSSLEVQTASGNNAIMFAFFGIPIFAFALVFVLMTIYDLDKKYPAIKVALKERREAEAIQRATKTNV